MAKSIRKSKEDWIQSAIAIHEAALLRYANRFLRNEELARDMVQETFLRLCREEIEKVDGHLKAWLFRVCRTRCIDLLRKENRMTQLNEIERESMPSQDPMASEILMRNERSSEVLAALNQLPPKQQEVVRLKFQEGLSYKEIGDVMSISVSNVGNLIHHGIKTLREKLSH